jgi:lysophospholipase L1-like esterase
MSDAKPRASSIKTPHPLRFRLILLATAIFISLAASEIAYRFYTQTKFQHDLKQWQSDQWFLIPGNPRQYAFIPGREGKLNYLQDHSLSFSYRINEQGFRGRTIPADTGNNLKHILFLGDSYTFGWALGQDEETFSRAVERLSNQDRDTTAVLTFNAGVPGYNTVQELALLGELAADHSFDYVVLSYVMNDAEPQITVPVSPRQRYSTCRFWLAERLKRLANEVILKDEFFKLSSHEGTFDYIPGFEADNPKWKLSRAALKEVHALCKSNGTGFSVFILPDFSRPLDDTYPFRLIHSSVSRWCEELDINHMDLFPFFEGVDNTRFYVPGDGHPNAEAHRRIGEIMTNKLRSELSKGVD